MRLYERIDLTRSNKNDFFCVSLLKRVEKKEEEENKLRQKIPFVWLNPHRADLFANLSIFIHNFRKNDHHQHNDNVTVQLKSFLNPST